jgi:hypothetical protein
VLAAQFWKEVTTEERVRVRVTELRCRRFTFVSRNMKDLRKTCDDLSRMLAKS